MGGGVCELYPDLTLINTLSIGEGSTKLAPYLRQPLARGVEVCVLSYISRWYAVYCVGIKGGVVGALNGVCSIWVFFFWWVWGGKWAGEGAARAPPPPCVRPWVRVG